MKKISFILFCLLICLTSFSQPTITAFSPASGPVGSSVILTGTGFHATANQNIVFLGATKATVTAASTTSLTVTVPLGATHQYISVTNLANNLTAYSAQPFVVTLAGSINFSAKVDFTTGTGPSTAINSDIDGDGKPDLVLTNRFSGTLSVFRNTSTLGTLSFASKVDFTTGNEPMSVHIGDIDGDGKPDLAVANYGSTTVSVLRNTSTSGTISFATKVDFAAGFFPNSLKINDINGDGKPDLIVANRGAGTVSVFRSTSTLGTISFAAKVDFVAGNQPNCVTVGDIDKDGKTDLAVANYSGNTVSVLRNTSTTGIISFAAKIDLTTGSTPYGITIGDIDGDGKSDLAVTNYNSNSVSVFRNTSTVGTIGFATKVDFTTGTGPAAVNIGDIDGDRNPDLAVTNYNVATVSVFRNTSTIGTINFATKVDFTTRVQPLSVSIGDLNGDASPDLAVANYNSNNVSLIQQIVSGLGVKETENINELSIYPNPFSTQTTLVSSNVLTDATFIVYNSFGQQVKQIQNISGHTITFHRNDLTSGLYFIQLIENDKVIAVKKIVMTD